MELKKKLSILIIILFVIFNIFFISKSFASSAPELNSEAAFLIESETGNILYEKNSTEKMYPASTTKILTAILAIENCDLDEIATVSSNAVALVPSGYTNARLVPGENISIKDLLYALMLNSANEAANVIAEHVSGSIDNFATLMNNKAIELGCKNSNFLNANGMHDDEHYTTAEDLAIITRYCMQNETFREIVSTTEYQLPSTNNYHNTDRIMHNTNNLIIPNSKYFYEYAIGVKTGFTSQAGNCLVSCANKDGVELICVTLKAGSTTDNSSYRFADNKALLEYGYENFSNQIIVEKNTVIETVEIQNGTKETKNLNIIVKDNLSDFINNNIDLENLKKDIKINENLKAPIYSGDILGTITYTLNDKTYSTDLIAETTVYEAPNFTSYFLLAGLILLVVSIIIVPKKKRT